MNTIKKLDNPFLGMHSEILLNSFKLASYIHTAVWGTFIGRKE
jgi:hypothetical protein